MSAHSAHEGSHSHGRLFAWVWIYLLVLTAVEVVLAYVHVLPPAGMLFLLMALSIVKAALIIAYFMHLRYERMNLILSLVPSVVVVIALLFAFFPDSFRLLNLRVH
ncbi:MAG: cytochrome C oxidase subunit IV family protein [Bryobacteraceae bacterium]|nr:cytochrome C oxidase subunit IV family protein [Bryobacteraceae bacterium]